MMIWRQHIVIWRQCMMIQDLEAAPDVLGDGGKAGMNGKTVKELVGP